MNPDLITSSPQEHLLAADSPLTNRLEGIRRRWKIVAIVWLIIFALIAIYTLRERKIYASTAKVIVATKKGQDMQMGNVLSGVLALQGGEAQSQVEIINSPAIIREAYHQIPEADRRAYFGPAYGGYIDPPEWSYEIHLQQDTEVMLVNTKSYNPAIAAIFANNIARAYLDADLARNQLSTKQGREYVDRERQRIKGALSKSMAYLAAYQRNTGLIAPQTQMSDLAKDADKAEQDLLAAHADSYAGAERIRKLDDQLKATQVNIDYARTMGENPEYAAVKTQLVGLQAQLAQVSQDYAPGSPERTDVERQLNQAERRLRDLAVMTLQSTQRIRNPIVDDLLKDYATAESDRLIADAKGKGLQSAVNLYKAAFLKFPTQEREFGELQLRVDELKSIYQLLDQRYYTLLIEEQSSLADGMIAAAAEAAKAPDSPKVLRSLFTALLLGLLLGCAAALVVEVLDKKVHRVEDVDQLSGVPNIALIPEVKSLTPDGDGLFIGEVEPSHAFVESFRILRNNLTFAAPDQSKRINSVTSSSMSEGKSTISANLGIVAAMDSQRVVIIDVDLRRPAVHKMMKVSNEIGLTNLVRGIATIDEVLQPTRWEGLYCITSGPIPPDPTEFLNSERTRSAIAEIAERFDLVILDSPPCVGISDMQIINKLVDGVLLVVAIDQVTKPQLTSALKLLRQARANLFGSCVNRVSRSNHGYYGYYGYYGYGYDDQDGKKRKQK